MEALSGFEPCVIFHNATVFLYRVGFHNQRNKEPFQSTLLSIIRRGFTSLCVSVLQMCFKVVPRERFELNYPPVMSRSLLPIKLPRQFTVSPVCHAYSCVCLQLTSPWACSPFPRLNSYPLRDCLKI